MKQLLAKLVLISAGLFGILSVLGTIANLLGLPSAQRLPSHASAPRPASKPPAVAPEAKPVNYRITGGFRDGGRIWRDVVVSGVPSEGELAAVAKELHTRNPKIRFWLYNDAAQIRNCDWTYSHPYEKAHGCDDDWLTAHDLGMINQMGPAHEWQLVFDQPSPASTGHVSLD